MILKYTVAVSKEILGRLRGKFSGKVPVDDEFILDYKELLQESRDEKNLFFKLRVSRDVNGFTLFNDKNK